MERSESVNAKYGSVDDVMVILSNEKPAKRRRLLCKISYEPRKQPCCEACDLNEATLLVSYAPWSPDVAYLSCE